jgi:hypothetical protein
VTGTPAAHAPALHVSPRVQALPSSQATPSAFGGLPHDPVAGLHVPACRQSFGATQMNGAPPTHAPPRQASPTVQAFASLQGVPSGFALPAHSPVPGSQVPALRH